MSFVNPFLLIGVLAAGIPVLIHLWSRRQARPIDFSHVRFLMSLHRRHVRRLKLKQILILILRMLIVILIALALARPILTSKWALAAGSRARSSVVIILDNSYSMSYETFEGTRFDMAKEQALRLLEATRSGDDASLILMSDLPDVFFKQLTSDIQQVRSAIENAQISHRGSNVWPSIQEAYTLLKRSDNPHKVIYFISDLGENGWQNWREPSEKLDTAGILVIKIGEAAAGNRAVEKITLSSEPVGIGMPVQISAKLIDSTSGMEATVELLVDGKKIGQAVANTGSVSFTHTFQHPGTHIGEVRLTSDRLTLDDVRRFVVDIPGKIRVLCIGDYRFYVNLALNPVTSLNPEAEFSILPVDGTVEELRTLSLDQYNVVILTDVPNLPEDVARNLESFVRNGGNLVVFLGETVDRDWYNDQFGIISVELGDRQSFSQAPLKLSSWSMDHPMFRAFSDESMTDVLNSPQFYSVFPMKPEPAMSVIASFNGDVPAILEAEAGWGRVLLFNSSPNTRVSNLSLSPAFVPLMQQAIFYLASEAQKTDSNIIVGDTYTRHIQGSIDSPPEVSDPADNVTTPSLTPTERGNQIEYGPTEQSGIYRLEFTSEGIRQRGSFVVNLDTSGESHLKAAKDLEVMSKLGERARFVPLDDSSTEASFEIDRGERRGELSSRLLIAAAILMLVEIPLANRRKIT